MNLENLEYSESVNNPWGIEKETVRNLDRLNMSMFYEKKWNKIIYKVNVAKKHLETIKNDNWEKISKSPVSIMAIQICLKKLWYNIGAINWIFHKKCIQAINKYKADNKINNKQFIKKILLDLNLKIYNDDKNKFNKYSNPAASTYVKTKYINNITEKQISREISAWDLYEYMWYAPQWIVVSPKETLYFSLYKKLSEQDYADLFHWLKDVKQWSLWDCYLIAAIKTLARVRSFKTLMMTSIEKNNDGSYYLHMPLWEPNWLKIKITPQDINLSKIQWSIWYKILEIWFIKYTIIQHKPIYNTEFSLDENLLQNGVWWRAWVALRNLLWPKSFVWKSIPNTQKSKDLLISELKKFDPKNWSVITASSNRRERWNAKSYETPWWKMYYHHAYSVYTVEKSWDTIKYVTLEDPANNKNKIKLSLLAFLSSISSIDSGRFTESFLNLGTLPWEVKMVNTMR